MNSQLLILMFVTGLFMSIWDSDQRHETTVIAIAAKKRAAAAKLLPVRSAPARTSLSQPFPIPEGLSAGKWRVLEERGRSYELNIEGDAESAPRVQFHLCTDGDGRRWCYVRAGISG